MASRPFPTSLLRTDYATERDRGMAAAATRDYGIIDEVAPREAWKGKRQVAACCQGGVSSWRPNN
ncbi:MAG TPA: hypothetical protein VE258_16655 [Ktedonobacterales bacterium]|nr:hypothetical protein [Ktedonobacterales bacterium]